MLEMEQETQISRTLPLSVLSHYQNVVNEKKRKNNKLLNIVLILVNVLVVSRSYSHSFIHSFINDISGFFGLMS